MKSRITACIIATFMVSLATVTACSSSSSEVKDAPPSQISEELEEADGDEETGTESDGKQSLLRAFSIMETISITQTRLECQCSHQMLGFDTYDACIVEHAGGIDIDEIEAHEACFAEGLDKIGEPPAAMHEYFDCLSTPLEAGLQCMEDDLETDNCDRVPDIHRASWFEACAEPYFDELDACDSLLTEIESDEEAGDWLLASEELDMECAQQ